MIYFFLRCFFRAYLRLAHRLDIRGAEHIPASGPVILCANHASYFDSMLVALCTPRPVRFLILRTFYRHPLLGPFASGCGAIPVTQTGNDRQALQQALSVLAGGGAVGVFPEGRLSRTGLLSRARPGAALLAAASGAPIVPITISGAFPVFRRGRRFPRPGRITVQVHPPVVPDPSRRREREYLQQLTAMVMGRIRGSLHHRHRVKHRQRPRHG